MNGLELVTLWAVVGKPDPLLLERTLRVLRYCHTFSNWHNDPILFTTINPDHYCKVESVRVIQIPFCENREQWQILIGRTIPKILEHYKWTLRLDEDGFIIESDLWHGGFLNYDYVSPPWADNGLVGSGGVALTSLLFNESLNKLPWYDGVVNMDEWTCRTHRQRLLELGVRFAPPEVAILFATENTDNDQPSFAYHGRKHSPDKYARAWRQLEAWERSAGWAK